MVEDEGLASVFQCSLSYAFMDQKQATVSSGQARACLDTKYLSITPEFGEPLLFPLAEILGVSEEDYRVDVFMSSKEHLTLSELGYKYEDFLGTLYKLRNEFLLKHMLMEEKLRDLGGQAEFIWNGLDGELMQKGLCELRLYDTALVILPQKGEPRRTSYSDITNVHVGNYRITLNTETGDSYTFLQMGESFEPFKKKLSAAITELSLRIQTQVLEILPTANSAQVRRLARLIREGRAANKSEVEAIAPDFWAALEKKVETAGLGEQYGFLKSMSRNGSISVGVKRGLLGNLTGDYVWFLVPIYKTDQQVGNVIAMEAVAEEGQGMATYLFRIAGRKEYADPQSPDPQLEVDQVLATINRCMVEINFRREPIYLPEEKLSDPRYEKYRFALQRLPSLQNLRRLFIGRVTHLSSEQWKADVMDLLRFNVGTRDDSAKWKKGVD